VTKIQYQKNGTEVLNTSWDIILILINMKKETLLITTEEGKKYNPDHQRQTLLDSRQIDIHIQTLCPQTGKDMVLQETISGGIGSYQLTAIPEKLFEKATTRTRFVYTADYYNISY